MTKDMSKLQPERKYSKFNDMNTNKEVEELYKIYTNSEDIGLCEEDVAEVKHRLGWIIEAGYTRTKPSVAACTHEWERKDDFCQYCKFCGVMRHELSNPPAANCACGEKNCDGKGSIKEDVREIRPLDEKLLADFILQEFFETQIFNGTEISIAKAICQRFASNGLKDLDGSEIGNWINQYTWDHPLLGQDKEKYSLLTHRQGMELGIKIAKKFGARQGLSVQELYKIIHATMKEYGNSYDPSSYNPSDESMAIAQAIHKAQEEKGK